LYSTISSRKALDVVAYSAAISASALGAQWEDAIALCADLRTGRLSPDVPWASKILFRVFQDDISVMNHHCILICSFHELIG